MERPMYTYTDASIATTANNCVGLVYCKENTFYFYHPDKPYHQDIWTPAQILSGHARFYVLLMPSPRYQEYDYVVAHNDGSEVMYKRITEEDEENIPINLTMEITWPRHGNYARDVASSERIYFNDVLQAFQRNDNEAAQIMNDVIEEDTDNNIDDNTDDELESNANYLLQLELNATQVLIELVQTLASDGSVNASSGSNANRCVQTKKLQVQQRIAKLVISDAIQNEEICPITMNPLTLETAVCVAPCYHVFDKTAIGKWLEANDTCPECRERCSL